MKRTLWIIALILLITGQAFAQLTITGQVKDAQGETVPGAAVLVKGTNKGTVADVNGKFKLVDVAADATLIFTSVGSKRTEVPVNNQSVINISMETESSDLGEVVVVGYGAVKRANLTGSVVAISAKDIEDIPTASLSNTLKGKLTGVKITQETGKPGAQSAFQIRTESSYGIAEAPLFVIDGVIRDQDAFDQLDPTEVESISILKDASAAVYGVKSTGGVVLVSTKKGKVGPPRISYSTSYGLATATRTPEMLSAYEHASMLNEALVLSKGSEDLAKQEDAWYTDDELEAFKTKNYNWLDGIWKNASQLRHTINISGGGDRYRYYTGGSMFNENGSISGLTVGRYSVRTSLEADVNKDIVVSLGMSMDQKNTQEPYNYYDSQSGVLKDTYKQLLVTPRWVPYQLDGKNVGNVVTWSPYGMLESGSKRKTRTTSSTLTGMFQYKIPYVEGLTFRTTYNQVETNENGMRYSQDYNLYNLKVAGTHNHIVTETFDGTTKSVSNNEGLYKSAGYNRQKQINASLSYNRKFGKHSIEALAVYEQVENESNSFWLQREVAAIKGYEHLWAFTDASTTNSESGSESGDMGYVGRLNYNYADKYLFESTVRRDASTKFPKAHRWGTFPAVSAGWVISEESFFKNNVPLISYMKFRGSAGLTGNDGVAAFQYLYLYSANTTGALFGSSVSNAIETKNDGVISSDITWQKTRSYNGGLDLRLNNNHINFAFDYFYRFTYDILTSRGKNFPTTAGFANLPDENYGEMYAKGYEIELGYNNKITEDWDYNVRGSFTWDKHRKVKVFQSEAAVGRWDDQLKNDPSNQPGYISTGIIRTQEQLQAILAAHPGYTINGQAPELGMLNYADIRGENYSEGPDGKIDANDMTTIAEYTTPPYNYSFNFGTGWKWVKIDATMAGEFGHKVFINKDENILPTVTSNVLSIWRDHWTTTNPNASMPRAYNYGLAGQYSTFWMRDGHTLRLTNINLSVTIPSKYTKKYLINSFRIFLTANNLWTIISPFDYKDPSVARAYDYPLMRTYNMGLNLTF